MQSSWLFQRRREDDELLVATSSTARLAGGLETTLAAEWRRAAFS